MEKAANLVIGIIRGSHGLAGKFKVESTSGETDHFLDLARVTLRKNGTEKEADIESVEVGSSFLIMKCAGIDTPEAVDRFKGAEIVVPRDKACPLYEDEYYVEDLKNCALIYDGESGLKAEDGLKADVKPEPLVAGIVTDVLEGGAGDLLEVSLSESMLKLMGRTDEPEKKRTVLVPFKKEFIGTVDTDNKTMQLMHLWILE